MAYINTIQELLNHKKRVLHQKELLPVGALFTDAEKSDLLDIYNLQLYILENSILNNITQIDVVEPFILSGK